MVTWTLDLADTISGNISQDVICQVESDMCVTLHTPLPPPSSDFPHTLITAHEQLSPGSPEPLLVLFDRLR